MPTCLKSLPGYQGGCQAPPPKLAPGQYTGYTGDKPGTLTRAERTRGAVAVSGICGESGESLKTLPDFPLTNSKPGVSCPGFSINGPGCQVGGER
ncbi:hypothetical protein ES708_21911 [subsurface metagenome]